MRAQAGVKQTSTTRQFKKKKKGSRVQAEDKDQTNAVVASNTERSALPLAEAGQQPLSELEPMELLMFLHNTENGVPSN